MTNPEKSQKKPHVHAEIIKAWADGAEIQMQDNTSGIWLDLGEGGGMPAFMPSFKYRIKPEEKRLKGEYRVALFSHYNGSNATYTSTADDKQQEEEWVTFSNFKGWLTDWIEYNVIDPEQK